MNEFSIIDTYFKKQALHHPQVIAGIGDDAACVKIPEGFELLISTDTLVAGVHFLPDWDAFDIALRSVLVNVSDLAAMAAEPVWASLALTLPQNDQSWLARFSAGLHKGLHQYGMALIGGDTTRGPLTVTLTVYGLAPAGKAVFRSGGSPGDLIWLSGPLGAAAEAIEQLKAHKQPEKALMDALLYPNPETGIRKLLQTYATAAIDISDGLAADLCHLCQASGTGALLFADKIPLHPLTLEYQGEHALSFALTGGDDYKLCFTTKASDEQTLKNAAAAQSSECWLIGVLEEEPGLRVETSSGLSVLQPSGYDHFSG